MAPSCSICGAKVSPLQGPQQAQHVPAPKCTEAALMRAWTGFTTHVRVKHLISLVWLEEM